MQNRLILVSLGTLFLLITTTFVSRNKQKVNYFVYVSFLFMSLRRDTDPGHGTQKRHLETSREYKTQIRITPLTNPVSHQSFVLRTFHEECDLNENEEPAMDPIGRRPSLIQHLKKVTRSSPVGVSRVSIGRGLWSVHSYGLIVASRRLYQISTGVCTFVRVDSRGLRVTLDVYN